MTMYVKSPPLLNSALGVGEWSASCPGLLTPRKDLPPPDTIWIWGWVAQEPTWTLWSRKICALAENRNPAVQHVVRRYPGSTYNKTFVLFTPPPSAPTLFQDEDIWAVVLRFQQKKSGWGEVETSSSNLWKTPEWKISRINKGSSWNC
jgi:hypothetical protein